MRYGSSSGNPFANTMDRWPGAGLEGGDAMNGCKDAATWFTDAVVWCSDVLERLVDARAWFSNAKNCSWNATPLRSPVEPRFPVALNRGSCSKIRSFHSVTWFSVAELQVLASVHRCAASLYLFIASLRRGPASYTNCSCRTKRR